MRSRLGTAWLIVVLYLVSGSALDAQGQERPSPPRLMQRGYLNLNAAYPIEWPSSKQDLRQELYGETAELEVHRAAPDDLTLDIAAGVRVWRRLSIGLGVSRFRTVDAVTVTGEVPSPLFVARPRKLTEHRFDGFETEHIGVHAHAGWTVPVAERLDVMLSLGPSLFRVAQDRVSRVVIAEMGRPHVDVEMAEVADVRRASVQRDVLGANVGLDIVFHIFRRVEPGAHFWTTGIGGFLRWSGAVAKIPAFGLDEPMEIGGLQAGLGLRFRY